jgi:hypothetical protein
MVTEHDVRELALALPSTVERPCYGTPGFRVRDRLFARLREEGDMLVLWCSDLDEKRLLLEAEPDRFCTTPHYDRRPLVLLRLAAVDRDELADCLEQAWRTRAPRRLVAELDAGSADD